MLAIKLRPVGKKKQVSYRVVVQKKRSKLKGRFVEDLGHYNPHTDSYNVNKERAEYWLGVGAQPTDTVHNLFVKAEIVDAAKRPVHSKKNVGKAAAEKAEKEAAAAEAAAAEEAKAQEAPAEEEAPAQEAADAPAEEEKSDDAEEQAEEPAAEEEKADDDAGDEEDKKED